MAINTILLDENNENVVILQNDSFLFTLEKGKVCRRPVRPNFQIYSKRLTDFRSNQGPWQQKQ